MPGPSTSTELLELVRKSGLVETGALQSWQQSLQSIGPLPENPRQLAGILVRDGLLTYFHVAQLLQGKHRGFHVGSYKFLERLGAGGMGAVYLCEQQIMRRRVAVKVLPACLAKDPYHVRRFQQEAQAAATLDHPNIVRVHDIFQHHQLHFLVMEYVDGVNMQELVEARGPLEVPRAAHYICQAALGLDHARQVGFIHRDIKPPNLVVNRQGILKILDFGIALSCDERDAALAGASGTSVTLGTADYLAPEQAMNSHDVDSRADVYSLGATFYFLLAGGPPFREGTTAQKLVWHQMRPPRPIRELRPDVPAELANVLHRMLAKDRAGRFQTPAAVAAALEPWGRTGNPVPMADELHRLSRAARGNTTAIAFDTSPGCRPGPTPKPDPRPSEMPTEIARQERVDTDPDRPASMATT